MFLSAGSSSTFVLLILQTGNGSILEAESLVAGPKGKGEDPGWTLHRVYPSALLTLLAWTAKFKHIQINNALHSHRERSDLGQIRFWSAVSNETVTVWNIFNIFKVFKKCLLDLKGTFSIGQEIYFTWIKMHRYPLQMQV